MAAGWGVLERLTVHRWGFEEWRWKWSVWKPAVEPQAAHSPKKAEDAGQVGGITGFYSVL